MILLEGWARNGLTLEQIAHNCGCSLSTLNEWRKRYPAILDALKKGQEVADLEVEGALFRRALGYSYKEKMTEEGPDGVKTRTTVKHVPPDTTAQIFWLKNRKSDVWRDKPRPSSEADGESLQRARDILRGVADALDE